MCTSDIFEDHYQEIGRTKGTYSTWEGAETERQFWTGRGVEGAEWLIRRIRDEWSLDALIGVANLLADIGAASVGPILRELESAKGGCAPDQKATLLKALGWIDAAALDAESKSRLVPLVSQFLNDEHADVREAAAAVLAGF